MIGRFVNNIAGTTASAPGVGGFTPNGPATQARAWSNVDWWIGLVRFEDVSNAWELRWCFWNGVILTRLSGGFVDSSTGTSLSLTAAAVAIMVAGAEDVMFNIGTVPWASVNAINGATGSTLNNTAVAVTATGTATAISASSGSIFNQRIRTQLAATAANGLAGWSHAPFPLWRDATAGCGGFEVMGSFQVLTAGTSMRMLVGASASPLSTVEPSTLRGCFFGKDQGDANIQFMSVGAVSFTKVNTGIVLASGGVYICRVWCSPGATKVHGLIVRLDTQEIFYGTIGTTLPTGTDLLNSRNTLSLGTTATVGLTAHFNRLLTRAAG
jgi:hypothetical protein